MAEAISSAGVALPPVRPMNAKRIDLAQMQGKVPAPLALLFSMSSGGIKTLEAPGKQGWYVISLTKIIPGDASSRPDLVAAAQQQIGRSMGDEYITQFANAIKASLGVKRNADAIAALKKGLTSNGGQ